ncbi:hypothetical protein KEM56_000523 [Ascosphaera pollenicola]|nr:hypothetical protein KEM56_000523 [Ascosphaera pollenicola]
MTPPNFALAGVAARHLDAAILAKHRPVIAAASRRAMHAVSTGGQRHQDSVFQSSRCSLNERPLACGLPSPIDLQRRHYSTGSDNASNGDDSLINSPPDLTSHYTIFRKTTPQGPPPSGPFDIPIAQLKREFLELQSGAHPDKYPQGIPKQKAEALSSRVNEAYRTLSDPLARAQYILDSQYGVDVTSESGAKEHPQDSETLMYVMEIQEEIEDAPDEDTIAKLKEKNDKCIKECIASMGEAFNSANVEAATKETVKLRFLYSVQHGLKEWEPGRFEIRLQH